MPPQYGFIQLTGQFVQAMGLAHLTVIIEQSSLLFTVLFYRVEDFKLVLV